MDDIKIRIGLGATIALPGYNSVRVDYSEEAIVPWDGDLKEAAKVNFGMANASMKWTNHVSNILNNL